MIVYGEISWISILYTMVMNVGLLYSMKSKLEIL